MFGERIKELRKRYKMTQKQLAEKLFIDQTAVSYWESGKTKPDFEKQQMLADLFDVSVDYLLGRDTVQDNRKKAIRIPVLGVIPAGIPMEAIEEIIDYEEAPESWGKGGNEYFALKIKGESMMPEYRNGDVIIFKKQNTCDNNDDCAVMVNGNDATFKRIEKLSEGIILKPLNPNFESKFYSNNEIAEMPIRIIGVFWELRRSRRGL